MQKGKGIKEIIKRSIGSAIYIGFAAMMLIFIHEKRNYHVDEILTYFLSNDTFTDFSSVYPEWYFTYDDPEQIWLRRMTVQPGQQFNYVNVWQRQAADVHPPLYYVIIHTISSFAPGFFSKWIAGGVNVLVALLTLYILRKTTRELTGNETIVFLGSLAFVFSAGVLSCVTFLRMYQLTMFFVALISYIFMAGMKKRGVRFYLAVFLTSLAGALTHYYFILYLFFICLAYGVWLLFKKLWRDVLYFVLSMGLAGECAVVIFPQMIHHSLGGYRGREVMDNLVNSDFRYMLKACYSEVNQLVFGGLFGKVMLTLGTVYIVGSVVARDRKHGKKEAVLEQDNNFDSKYRWILLWFPVAAYFMIVSKITIYVTDRYFFPIYSMLLLLFVGTLYSCLKKFFSKKTVFVMVSVVLLITTFKNFRTSFYYLYRSTQTLLDAAAEHHDTDCIFIFNDTVELTPAFREFSNYRSLTLVPSYGLTGMADLILDTGDGVVVSMGKHCSFDEVYEEVMKVWPLLVHYEEMGEHAYTVSYFFYPDK